MTTVSDILSRKGREVVSMSADDTVLSAARSMNEHGIGGVVVIDKSKMVGIFTERDVLRRIVAEQRDPATTRLEEVMTTPVASCRPETGLDECVRVMTGKRIRHLPVVDDDGVCGIVTSGDIMAFQVREQEDTIQYLNSYIFDLR
jgi:CBS domain-containing protein